MPKPKSPSELVQKLAAKATTGRARMYLWVRENYADIETARTDLRSTWDDIAKVAEAAGQRNARGEPPQAEALRKTFMRVEAEKRAAAKLAVSKSDPAPRQSRLNTLAKSGPGAPAPEPSADDDTDYQPMPKHTWTPTKLK